MSSNNTNNPQPKNNIDDEIEIISTQIDNKETTVVTVSEFGKQMFEQAMYDFQNKEHLYSRFIGTNESSSTTTTTSELNSLAMNPQNDVEKIRKINSIVKTYINKDDLCGKVMEVLENNVNIQTKKNFSNVPTGRNKIKTKEKAEELINQFDEKIDLERLIRRCVSTTYSEGNFVTYLRSSKTGYVIDVYPLGIIEVSSYEVDGEPLLLFNVDELKSRLSGTQNIFKSLKTKNNIPKSIDEEIQRNYPVEVYEAFKNKDKYAILDPERASIIRINNLNGLYGVTPMFKSLPSQLMLETIDNTDKKNTIAKGKKFIVQILRKELLGVDYTNTQAFGEMAYAHSNLLEALSKDTVVATCPAYVEKIEMLEAKQTTTDINTINYYRNKVLSALGITYLSNETKNGANTVSISASEMLRTINKITNQLEKVLNKYYKLICTSNRIDLAFCPNMKIIDTELMDLESKLKMVDLLYSKIGASYRTTFELLDLDYETEIQRRVEENNFDNGDNILGFDSLFVPHGSSYTSNSNDMLNQNTEKSPENQNKNLDKKLYDKTINDNKV